MLRLECRSGGHNKYYEFEIVREGLEYVATAYYGRIGNGPQTSHIGTSRILGDVTRAVTSKMSEKLAKGYVQVSDTGWAFQGQLDGPPQPRPTTIPPPPPMRRRRRSTSTPTQVATVMQTRRTARETARDRREDAEVEANLDSHIDEILAEEDDVAPSPNAPRPKVIPPTLTIWAMNAQGVRDGDHVEELFKDDNYIAQEKLDGMRAVVHITDRGLRIFSRSAGVADNTRPLEKTQSLPHLKDLVINGMEGCVLDTELLMPDSDSANIAGAVNSKEGTSRAILFVFDLLVMHGVSLMDSKLSVRLGMLQSLSSYLMGHDFIRLVPYHGKEQTKRALLQDILSVGREGIMFKNLSATYCQGGRPANNWYKCKKSATYDVVIMGFTEGQGKFVNGIGAVVFGQYLNGQLTEMGQTSGMTDDVREAMSDDREMWVGQVMKVGGMERLKSGAIRHPRYLGLVEDKRAEDCIYSATEQ